MCKSGAKSQSESDGAKAALSLTTVSYHTPTLVQAVIIATVVGIILMGSYIMMRRRGLFRRRREVNVAALPGTINQAGINYGGVPIPLEMPRRRNTIPDILAELRRGMREDKP